MKPVPKSKKNLETNEEAEKKKGISRKQIIIFFVVALIISAIICSMFFIYPRIALSGVTYKIQVEKDEYSYGEIIEIDLVLKNNWVTPVTIFFDGYGGDQYELDIENGYHPTTNALSSNKKTTITLQPDEKKVFHHDWNLFFFSQGGCTGPRRGDLVPPGEYRIESFLNLDSVHHGKINREDTKIITILNHSASPREFTISLFENPDIDEFYPVTGIAYENFTLIEYYPPYEFEGIEVNHFLPEILLYKNGCVYIDMKYNFSLNRGVIVTYGHPVVSNYKVEIKIDNPGNEAMTSVAVYDSRFQGWGSPEPQIGKIDKV